MRSLRLLLVAALVAASSSVALPALAVDPPTVIGGVTSVAERADHATDLLRDPWDYTEQTDIPTDLDFITLGIVEAEITDGYVRFVADPDRVGNQDGQYSYATLKMMAAPFNSNERGDENGALVDAWDGLRYPIDADRMTQVTMRIWSSQLIDTPRFTWHTCHAFDTACQGATKFGLVEGWQTITLDLGPNQVLGYEKDWAGDVLNLRLEVSPDTTVEVRLDWLRIHEPIRDEVLVDAPGGGRVYWDLDTDPNGIGTPDDRSSGRLPRDGDVVRFPVESFPPGDYHLWTVDGGYGDTITIRPQPRPFIDDPDLAGGVDYAAERLGNPWDFEDEADVRRVCNSTNIAWLDSAVAPTGRSASGVLGMTNGRFDCSTPPENRPNIINDPYVELQLASGGLDPLHYHRVTIDTWFDRPFDLADDSGGGAHGRFIWRTRNSAGVGSSSDFYADGREMVVFTNRTRYSYDMTDTTWGKTTESIDDPWGDGAPITFLRYDPNEDTSDRRSFIDELRIAADDAADPTFDITFHDAIAPSGSTYSMGLDTNRVGFDGRMLADEAPLRQGANTVRVDATSELPQAWWVWLEVTTPTGETSRVYADAILQVSPRISGPDRIATAVSLSGQRFDRASSAVVAQATTFPDALAAVQLAAAVEGPLLLTTSDRVDDRVLNELERLGVDRIFVAGGEVAISADAVGQLSKVAAVTRIGGETRYDTAAALARRSRTEAGLGAPSEVLIALGTNFPDALAAAPYVTSAEVPLLLVAPDTVPEATASLIRSWNPERVTVVGGPGAIPDPVAESAATGRPIPPPDDPATPKDESAVDPDAPPAATRTLRRLAGGDRFATAVVLLDEAVAAGADPTRILIATGRAFPDALGAGAALAADGGVMLLTEGDFVPSATVVRLSKIRGVNAFRVLGGPSAVSHAVVRHLRELAGL